MTGEAMKLEPADPPSLRPTSHEKARIFLVDDHAVLRLGLQKLIAGEPDLVVCGEASSAKEALHRLRSEPADLVLVDISLPDTNGIELIKNLRAEKETLPILVLSTYDESQYALRALRAGASGYLMKTEPSEELMLAIRRVLKGEIAVSKPFGEQLIFKVARGTPTGASPLDRLSDRELEILALVGNGKSTAQIAEALGLSVKTVESHRLHAKEKLGLRTSPDLVRFAIEWVADSAAARQQAS